ncbi:MAG: hypothetical protein WC444_04680 [Candidatus Paceibacterota bacterium]
MNFIAKAVDVLAGSKEKQLINKIVKKIDGEFARYLWSDLWTHFDEEQIEEYADKFGIKYTGNPSETIDMISGKTSDDEIKQNLKELLTNIYDLDMLVALWGDVGGDVEQYESQTVINLKKELEDIGVPVKNVYLSDDASARFSNSFYIIIDTVADTETLSKIKDFVRNLDGNAKFKEIVYNNKPAKEGEYYRLVCDINKSAMKKLKMRGGLL